VTSEAIRPATSWRAALAPFAVGLAFLLAAVLWGVVRYPQLPEQVAVHWNAAGNADGFAEKTVWSVLGVPFVGLLIAVLLFVVATMMHRLPQPEAQVAASRRMIGRLLVVVSINLSVLSVLGWYPAVPGWLFSLVAWVGTAVLLAVPIAFIVRAGRSGALRRRSDADEDRERYWRAGLVYLNRSDPSILVPKRLGVGWTVNFGSPVGIVVGIALLAVIVFAVVIAVV
jgi:uncharacterized membrane protein